MDFLSEFIDYMHTLGNGPANASEIVADDKKRRYQLAGERGKKSASYQLRVDSDFAVGWFRSFKEGVTHKWSSKSKRDISPEERKAWKKRVDAQRDEQAQRLRDEQAAAAVKATRIWERSKRVGESEYLKRKQVEAISVRFYRGLVVVPIYIGGKITSLQFIAPDGQKRFVKESELVGGYCSIASKGTSLETIVICEGYATGASVHAATGLPVIVAFNAGNLKPVAVVMRAKYPDARFVIAADNDQWTKRADGSSWNPGQDYARQAAVAINGAIVVWPEVDADDEARRTDWNDIAVSDGLGVVRDRIFGALAHRPEDSASEHGGGGGISSPYVPEGSDAVDVQPAVSTTHEDEGYSDLIQMGEPSFEEYEEQVGDFGMKFRVLGYNNGLFYYFPFFGRQIVALGVPGHTIQNLLQLDELDAWERKFGATHTIKDKETGQSREVKTSHAKIALYSANAMVKLAQERGVFMEEDRVRGAGAWIDEGRVVLHCGDMLFVNGKPSTFDNLRSHFTYVAAPRVLKPADEALSNFDANRLRVICESISWENPLSGALLAGWLAIAPICGALVYRPHIYLTGEAESGKSTVMDAIIKPVLGKMSLNVDGGTTEPAIREMMGYDGRPLVFDEAEPSDSMISVIGLARKASTGSTVKKFGQRPFKARFCACFSAINPPVNKTADESRISFLVIKKNRKPTAMQDYDDLMAMIDETITPDFSSKLIARTLDNMDELMKNIKTFQRAARKSTGGARASQQIGTMLAGLYLLGRTDVVAPDFADEWVARYEWTDHTIVDQQTDPIRLVQHIAGSLVRYSKTGADISIGELINLVHSETDAPANKMLRYYGIAVHAGRVDIASRSQNLGRLLRETDWHEKWSRTLSDVPGAERRKIVYFGPGVKTSAVSLPVELFSIGDEE
jgi:putative DNA primase/helicase